MPFLSELKRRNVFRVAAAYAAIAWLVVQVAETVLPVFGADSGTLRIVVILVAIGFVPAVVAAWLYELTPQGLKRDDGVEPDPGFSRLAHDRLNRVILVSLSLVVVILAVDKFVFTDEASVLQQGGVSVAVLPFVNLSESEDMVFFSDGVAEDILGLLSRTRGLRCIARSSSFAFRDENLSAATIGERLGVEYVLTGTLRSHDNDVRLSVRLVEASSETLVWSENYDRSVDDIFAIQDDISRQVVDAVAPTLTATLHSAQAESTQHYIAYLRARHVYLKGRNNNDPDTVLQAIELFEDILDVDPEYARAHAGLADAWSGLAILGTVGNEEGYTKAKRSAQRAMEIDPDSADAWYAYGDILVEYDWDLPAAKAAYDRARSIAPKDADGLRGYAYFLRQAGRTDDALATYREALTLDPFSFRARMGLYITLVNSNRDDELEALIDETVRFNPALQPEALRVPVYANRLQFDRLAAALPAFLELGPGNLGVLYSAMAKRGLGDQVAGDKLIQNYLKTNEAGTPSNYTAACYFAAFGDFDQAIEYLEAAVNAREIGLGEALTMPLLRELRKEPMFWEWVEKAGIRPLE